MITTIWDGVTAALSARGRQALVVAVERLEDLRARAAHVLDSNALPEPAASHLAEEIAFALPEGMSAPRSVVIGAVAPPETFAERETTAILAAAERSELTAATLDKLERCGLDY